LALRLLSVAGEDNGCAGDEMLANFRKLTAEGITFRYVQCDVTDQATVQRAAF
jgi:hypothetical protein